MKLSENEFLQISTKTPLVNVDLFIVNQYDEILLVWRDDEYCGTGWHIPGGIIRHGETIQARLQETAMKEIGFLPKFEIKPCKITEIILKQNYRDHFISHLFKGYCRRENIKTVKLSEKHNKGDLCWFSYNPGLVYSQSAYEIFLKEYFANLPVTNKKRNSR